MFLFKKVTTRWKINLTLFLATLLNMKSTSTRSRLLFAGFK